VCKVKNVRVEESVQDVIYYCLIYINPLCVKRPGEILVYKDEIFIGTAYHAGKTVSRKAIHLVSDDVVTRRQFFASMSRCRTTLFKSVTTI
jgi:hypothetical protein